MKLGRILFAQKLQQEIASRTYRHIFGDRRKIDTEAIGSAKWSRYRIQRSVLPVHARAWRGMKLQGSRTNYAAAGFCGVQDDGHLRRSGKLRA